MRLRLRSTHMKRCDGTNYIIKACMYITTLTVLYPQKGATALHLAAQEGKVDVVRLLIDAEAQVNTQTKVHTLLVE